MTHELQGDDGEPIDVTDDLRPAEEIESARIASEPVGIEDPDEEFQRQRRRHERQKAKEQG